MEYKSRIPADYRHRFPTTELRTAVPRYLLVYLQAAGVSYKRILSVPKNHFVERSVYGIVLGILDPIPEVP